MDREREAHWQRQWAEARLATAERRPDREKFYALVAYPGSSGFIHIGHLRGLLLTDAMHRYHRMLGHQVFFPTGTHASGLPAVTFAQKVHDRDPTTIGQLEDNGVDPALWTGLEDPARAASFLGTTYLEVFRRCGLLIDERAYVTTIDPDYQSFIRWQFHRLQDAGMLVQAPHFSSVCPICGPVSVDPSETDLSSGGDAEVVRYTTVPFSLGDGRILLAATLRPETVFGVTNLWLPPQSPLTVWHHESGVFLVTRTAAERLVEQHGGRVGHSVPIEELVGRTVEVPVAGRTVPIRLSPIVDPNVGTGVVMSVPAHAPADTLALSELSETDRIGIPPVVEIVEVPADAPLTASERGMMAGEGTPAQRALAATGATRSSDLDAVEEATERLYRLEFIRGKMTVPSYPGMPVPQVREAVTRVLAQSGTSFELQEFSKPVICRNGHHVVIRRVPAQWFLHYSDPEWKRLGHELAQRMTIYPEEYGRELPQVLDWFQDRPCTRQGRWLGTPFPFDPAWVIEPIADSTFYPAYFVVRRYVSDGRLRLGQLTDAFFDFVFLGRGPGEPSVDRPLLESIREDFRYWYPLDFNVGGKEHKRVHFPVFLMTHALLLPPELQPRGFFVNWWLVDRGGAKISKKQVTSKGGLIPPIRASLDQWGADAIRLFHATAASPFQDIEWDRKLVDAAADRLSDVERLIREIERPGDGSPELEAWLESKVHTLVAEIREHFQSFEIREAAEAIYVTLPSIVRRYVTRGGGAGTSLHKVAEIWIRLMSPITPHLAEELAHGRSAGLVAQAAFPSADELGYSAEALIEEEYLERIETDLRDVLRPNADRPEAPDEVVFYVASPWKTRVEEWLREAARPGAPADLRGIMDRAAHHPELAAYRPEIPKYVQRVSAALRTEPVPGPLPADEVAFLKKSEGYLSRRFRFRSVGVYREAEAADRDPKGRRERARPGRPAFYLFRSADAGARTQN